MKKKPTKDLIWAKDLRNFLKGKRGFGNKVCKELVMDCGNCMGQTLIGFLNWYINLVAWSRLNGKKPKKKIRKKWN